MQTLHALLIVAALALVSVLPAVRAEDAPPIPKDAPPAVGDAKPTDEKSAPSEASTSSPSANSAKPSKPVGPPPELPLKSSAFFDVVDGLSEEELYEAQKVEFRSLEEIVRALQASSQEHLDAHINPAMSYEKLMRTPQECRGQVVHFKTIYKMQDRFPLLENSMGLERLYLGFGSNIRGEIVAFLSIDPIPESLKPQQSVRFTGIFLKRYAYYNRDAGDKLSLVPLIFVKSVEPYTEPDTRVSFQPGIASSALFVLITIGLMAFAYHRMNARNARGNLFATRRRAKDGVPGLFPGTKYKR